MIVCYVCNKFVDKDHECLEAKRLAENAASREDKSVPWVTMKAVPSRSYIA